MAKYPDLAGYWDFNYDLLDLSGNENHGKATSSGGFYTGRLGKSLYFNGSTVLNCGVSSEINIKDNISIEFWFYPKSWVSGFAAHVINKWGDTSDANYVMYFFGDAAGGADKQIRFFANAGGTWQAVSGVYTIPSLNTWYHVVWTYNSTAGGKLYVNGGLRGSATGSGVLATNNEDLIIGKRSTYPGFDGYIDELKIYDRVLTLTETQEKNQDALTRGVWNLHNNTLDFSGNDNTGIVTGTEKYAAGKVGRAFDFDGSSSIDFGNETTLGASDNISVEFWFYPKSWVNGSAAHVINKWGDTSDANYVMYFFGRTAGGSYKKIAFLANAGGIWKAVSPYYEIPSLDTWYHVVWTYNSTTGGILYINGSQYGSATGSGILATNTSNLVVGKRGANPGFDGYIDEFKVYNRVLSSAAVSDFYSDLGTYGKIWENSKLKIAVNSGGQITQFHDKTHSTDYKGGTVFLGAVKKGGAWYYATSCLEKDGKFLVDFGASKDVTAELTTKTEDDYHVFQIHSVYGDTDNLEYVQLFNINPSMDVSDSMSGIMYDVDFALVLRGMNAMADVSANVFPANSFEAYGVESAKWAILGTPVENLQVDLETLMENERMSSSSMGGPFALNEAENKCSYISVDGDDLTTSNINQYISLAQGAGCKIINIMDWWNSAGHYVPNMGLTDMKSCIDSIHAAGLKASLHVFSCSIGSNDSYITPIPDSRLQKDGIFILSSAITSSSTTITVNETISSDMAGNVIQIDNELITYTGNTSNSFTGCTRGALSTTATSHSAETSVGHLRRKVNQYFFPDPGSTLVREIADNISDVVNYCGFDMIYMDAIDWAGDSYATFQWASAITSQIGRSIRIEAASATHQLWPHLSNIGAWDYPCYGIKTFIDKQHLQSIKDHPYTKLLPINLGWWRILGDSADHYSQLPDEFELLCARALGSDACLSYLGLALSIPDNDRQDEYLEMAYAYETLRAAGTLSAAEKAVLLTPGAEFHLDSGGNIVERKNLEHKVTGLSDGSQSWTVNNSYSSQAAKCRIRALDTVKTNAYDDDPSILLTDFQTTGEFSLTSAGGVSSQFTKQAWGCTFTASNSNGSAVGAWSKMSKTYSTLLDISGGYDTIGVWIYGDNKGEVMNFQLYQPTVYAEHYVIIDFSGWKYFELFLRERDADKYYDYTWPYVISDITYPMHRTALARNNITNLNIYYNNIPAGQSVSCSIKSIKALATASASITNPSITISGNTITFPVTLDSGEYIEFYSTLDCKHYSKTGELLGNVTPTGTVPTVGVGDNTVIFGGTGTSGYNARANVTMIMDGNIVVNN